MSKLVSANRKKSLKRLQSSLDFQRKKREMKAESRQGSSSLLWVWEFSKKAVLICFVFYVIVQVYSMAVMVRFYDFTYLGTLIEKTADLTERCVFAYLIKAGLENVGKIWFSRSEKKTEEGPEDGNGPVG